MAILRARMSSGEHAHVEKSLICREEVTAILGVLADINVNVRDTLRLLQDEIRWRRGDSER